MTRKYATPLFKTLRCGLLIMWLMTIATNATAAWISLCPSEAAAPADAKLLAEYSDAMGRKRRLLASPVEQAGCASHRLPPNAGQIVWGGLVSGDVAQHLGDGVILQGILAPDRLSVSEILPLQAPRTPPAPPVAPLEANLLSSFDTVSFGVEERASVTPRGNNPASFECRAGARPAGVVLRSRWILPRGVELAVDLRYRGSAAFDIGVSDRERSIREEPQLIGTMASDRQAARFNLPATEPGSVLAWSVLCPDHAARIEISSLQIVAINRRTPLPARAMWAWRPQWWMDEAPRLFEKLHEGGADTVYITIPMVDRPSRIEHRDALQRFIGEATQRGVKVWSVEGDPRAVLPEARDEYVQRARRYSEYNRTVADTYRLQGVQYDIEPYLVPGYQLATAEWLSAYLDAIAAFKAELGMPLELAVPYWWAQQNYAGKSFLDRLAVSADSLAVMNYSTNPESIRAGAEPFLAWSARFTRGVRISLEAGPLADEQRRFYRKSAAGELWQISLPQHTALLLFDRAGTNPAGPAFSFSRAAPAPANRISFAGKTQMMFELLPEFEKLWSAWPGFSGIALHGLLP